MSMTDPISDFLTRVRNGIIAEHDSVEVPASKLKNEMATSPGSKSSPPATGARLPC
jgi:ribosomal protein S8